MGARTNSQHFTFFLNVEKIDRSFRHQSPLYTHCTSSIENYITFFRQQGYALAEWETAVF
jgi:predicted secreted protein